MSEAIIGFAGVLVGGLIGTIGTVLALIYQNKQWKTNRRIEYLQNKRDRFAKNFDALLLKNFKETEDKSKYDLFLSELSLRMPIELREKVNISKLNLQDSKDQTKLLITVYGSMGDYLATIEKEIDDLTK